MCRAVEELIMDSREEGIAIGKDKGISVGKAEGMAEGMAEGISIGQNTICQLMQLLFDSGRFKDAVRAASDPEWCTRLLIQFGLMDSIQQD